MPLMSGGAQHSTTVPPKRFLEGNLRHDADARYVFGKQEGVGTTGKVQRPVHAANAIWPPK